jgi:anti-anti-sigma regulatory factor
MQWSARISNGCSVLKVSGPVTRVDAARLKMLLSPKGMSTTPVVDISEVTFLGPAGLEVLAGAASPLADCPWPLAVVVGDRHPQVVHAIEDAHLQQTLRLFDTVEHALAAGPTESGIARPPARTRWARSGRRAQRAQQACPLVAVHVSRYRYLVVEPRPSPRPLGPYQPPERPEDRQVRGVGLWPALEDLSDRALVSPPAPTTVHTGEAGGGGNARHPRHQMGPRWPC